MSTLTLADHSAEALAAAIADLGRPAPPDDTVDSHLRALGAAGAHHVFGALAGWAAAMQAVLGEVPSGAWGAAVVDPGGRVSPAAVSAGRILAALLNGQEAAAWALFLAALEAGHAERATVLVLDRVATAVRGCGSPEGGAR